jgi:hypothetical protein
MRVVEILREDVLSSFFCLLVTTQCQYVVGGVEKAVSWDLECFWAVVSEDRESVYLSRYAPIGNRSNKNTSSCLRGASETEICLSDKQQRK